LETERTSYFPRDEILKEIVERSRAGNPDYVTFVGDGEPTLCADLGWLIEKTRAELEIPIAVITNGSLLWREDVRDDLADADIVIPSLDAGRESTFKTINRPHRKIDFRRVIQGQISFSRSFKGRVWLEIMLVEDINDTEEELLHLKRIVDRIRPDRVYILTPIRPPAESWVKIPSFERILEAQEIIGGAVTLAELESGDFELGNFDNARDAILEISLRHPLRLEQAMAVEGKFSQAGTIERMLAADDLVRVKYQQQTYLLPSRFVRGRHSESRGRR
jgi:wyosine [tRNA(Phe)-imidazoG37] synthetase (radical SAM superfamily)